ncbi:MAG: hypothetical protein K6T83_11635 [Alicyclobacillus sp.]|nr:hypothetical protein [Alicyclobacillus sp.]
MLGHTSQERQGNVKGKAAQCCRPTNGLMFTVKKIIFGPVTTFVDYEIAQPRDAKGQVKYAPKQYFMGVFDQTGKVV